MASKFMRRRTWWVKFQHPVTGVRIRESLETHDPARAELLRRRIELEVELSDPRFRAADIPSHLREQIEAWSGRAVPGPVPESSTPVIAVVVTVDSSGDVTSVGKAPSRQSAEQRTRRDWKCLLCGRLFGRRLNSGIQCAQEKLAFVGLLEN